MANFSLLINPAGMTPDVLEQTVGKFLALPLQRHAVVFQGEDPLSAGQDFFLSFVGLVNRYSSPETHPSYTLQTDGTLITDGWAQLFAAHHIVVSVNLDTPPQTATAGGWAGIERLKKFNVPFTTRTRVNRANVNHPETVYRYLRDEVGCNSHHYIPCTDSDADTDSAITGEQWGDFLCRLYDVWFPTDKQKVSVRFFDAILAQMVQGAEVMCECSSDCRASLVIAPTGDVYPCAFYMTPDWNLGNVLRDDFFALLKSPVYEAFGMRKRKWPATCQSCDALRYCRGDCVSNRDLHGNSILCDGLKAFYAHVMPTLTRFGWQLYQKVNHLTPGRNDPCPCGSGKKLKKCCAKASGGE